MSYDLDSGPVPVDNFNVLPPNSSIPAYTVVPVDDFTGPPPGEFSGKGEFPKLNTLLLIILVILVMILMWIYGKSQKSKPIPRFWKKKGLRI
jgi:hypothetical protein